VSIPGVRQGRQVGGAMIIDCDSCEVRGLACGDCVVSYVLGPIEWGSGSGIADEERAALAVLADSGLLPPLRLVSGPKIPVCDDNASGRAVS
jgi:hypothetical protein